MVLCLLEKKHSVIKTTPLLQFCMIHVYALRVQSQAIRLEDYLYLTFNSSLYTFRCVSSIVIKRRFLVRFAVIIKYSHISLISFTTTRSLANLVFNNTTFNDFVTPKHVSMCHTWYTQGLLQGGQAGTIPPNKKMFIIMWYAILEFIVDIRLEVYTKITNPNFLI